MAVKGKFKGVNQYGPLLFCFDNGILAGDYDCLLDDFAHIIDSAKQDCC